MEETGVYQNEYHPPQQELNGRTANEWEEAVELDKILENERNAYSLKRLAAKQDDQYNNYLSQLANPNLKNGSNSIGGILGGEIGSNSPYFNANGSLPDLKQ